MSDRPGSLPERPEPPTRARRPAASPDGADPFADVLRAVRLSGAVFFDVHANEPWVAEAPASREIARHVRPLAGHVIEFHGVVAGTCFGGLVGEPPIRLAAGDVLAFPHGDAHVLSSAPGMRSAADLAIYPELQHRRLPVQIHQGPPGPPTAHLVCGFLGCDLRPFNPLLAALPRMLHHRGGGGDQVQVLLRHAVAESHDERPGRDAVLTRLSELLFIELLRRYQESLPPEATGWLGALRDPVAGRALALLHQRPAHPWGLDTLARSVATSRSVLAERFRASLGLPPMQYLAQWRMQLAASLLEGTSDSIAAIAAEVGYQSEAAFQRAFRKVVGVPPGSWRRRQGSAQ